MLVENVPLALRGRPARDRRAALPVDPAGRAREHRRRADRRHADAAARRRAGEHVVEFKLAGYFDTRQTIKVEGGKERIVQADLKALPTGPTPEQVARTEDGDVVVGREHAAAGRVRRRLRPRLPVLLLRAAHRRRVRAQAGRPGPGRRVPELRPDEHAGAPRAHAAGGGRAAGGRGARRLRRRRRQQRHEHRLLRPGGGRIAGLRRRGGLLARPAPVGLDRPVLPVDGPGGERRVAERLLQGPRTRISGARRTRTSSTATTRPASASAARASTRA